MIFFDNSFGKVSNQLLTAVTVWKVHIKEVGEVGSSSTDFFQQFVLLETGISFNFTGNKNCEIFLKPETTNKDWNKFY